MLREPIARELSQLKYLRAFDEAQIHAYGTIEQLVRLLQSLPPSKVLRSDYFRTEFANMQVRCLTGAGPPCDSPLYAGA